MRLTFLVIIIFLPKLFLAQVFSGGVSFGVNGSQVQGDYFTGYNKVGLSPGVFVKTRFSEDFAIQVEMRYSQKGSRKNPRPDIGDNDQLILRLNYLDLPILAEVKYKTFFFEGGIYLGRFLGYYLRDEFSEISLERFNWNTFKTWELGGTIGLRYIIDEHWDAGMRFNNSILPIREYDPVGSTTFDRDNFNMYFTMVLNYRIGDQ